MGGRNFRDAYEYDPETYANEGGGLPGMLRRAMMLESQPQGVDFGSTPNGAREYNPETSFSLQGGLLGRLLSLQAEQSRYHPFVENGGQPPSMPRDSNFGQLSRVPNGTPQQMPGSPAPQAEASSRQTQAKYEADQAQQARDAAASRLARGVRSLARAEAPPPDPIDIAKSSGIGLAKGVVNAAGLPGDALTGFGYFPNNLLLNGALRVTGYPEFPADAPDWIGIGPGLRQFSIGWRTISQVNFTAPRAELDGSWKPSAKWRRWFWPEREWQQPWARFAAGRPRRVRYCVNFQGLWRSTQLLPA